MQRSYVILIAKLGVIAAALALVIHKADTTAILQYIVITPLYVLLSGFVLVNAAQYVSALRMRYYFRTAKVHFGQKFAVAFYYLGMFYNMILPGGIGGDGYKIYKISKLSGCRKRDAARLILSERASGLYILIMLFFLLVLLSDAGQGLPALYICGGVFIAMLITTVGYFISIGWLLKESTRKALGAMPYSLAVQGLGLLLAYLLFSGMGVEDGATMIHYLLLFQASAVVAVIPISIGGVGLRELTFLYGAPWLGVNAELGIAFAVIFFVLNMLCSLQGGIFIHGLLERLYDGKRK